MAKGGWAQSEWTYAGVLRETDSILLGRREAGQPSRIHNRKVCVNTSILETSLDSPNITMKGNRDVVESISFKIRKMSVKFWLPLIKPGQVNLSLYASLYPPVNGESNKDLTACFEDS